MLPDEARMRREEQVAERRFMDRREDDMLAAQVADYYSKPQTDTQLNNNYIEPDTENIKLNEWTRDSVISSYGPPTQHKIRWCIEEMRILEMMRQDAKEKGDYDMVKNFCNPLIRFNISEKSGEEITSGNLGGYRGQLSRSNFSYVQQDRFNQDAMGGEQKKGFFGKLSLPKFQHGWSGGESQQMGWR